jgi:rod shape-determining protein MreD
VIAPAGLFTVIVFGSILPLGLDAADIMLAPHFLICVVYFWGVRAPRQLPGPVIFAFGLLIDLLTAGPLGFWPLVLLLAHGLSLIAARFVETSGFAFLCAGFVPVAAAAELVAWAVGCLYFGAWIDPWPHVMVAAAMCIAFPVLALLFARLAGVRAAERGGA